MNAHDKGRENGFAYRLSIIGGSKNHFEAVGKKAASKAYKTQEKQEEFLAGWMENWTEPHPQDCTCERCRATDSEIQTY